MMVIDCQFITWQVDWKITIKNVIFFSFLSKYSSWSNPSPEESSLLAMIGGYLEFSKGFSPRMHFSEAAKLCHTCFDKWTLLTDNQTVSSNISLSDDLLICKNENIKNPWKKILAPLAQSVRSRYNKSQRIIAAKRIDTRRKTESTGRNDSAQRKPRICWLRSLLFLGQGIGPPS